MSSRTRTIAAGIVILIFILALVYIFVLSDRLHAVSPSSKPIVSTVTLQVPAEPLIYSGDEFLPMEGVTATNEQGQDVSEDVTVSIKKTGDKAVYTLQYAYFGSKGERASATRRMEVQQYSGAPVIQVLVPHYQIDAELLPSLGEILRLKGIVRAEDGFGHDISAGLTVTVEPANNAPIDSTTLGSPYIAILQVENFLGDTSEATLELQVMGAVDTTTTTLPIW